LEKYGVWMEKNGEGSKEAGPFKIDQIEGVINKLCKQPFTRQAQMITWMPNLDLDCFDPPCLQSLWYRILEDEEGIYWLNCNIRLNWQADSYHIYGRDIQQAKEMLFDRVNDMNLEERTYHFTDDFIRDMYDAAEPGILEKIKAYDSSH